MQVSLKNIRVGKTHKLDLHKIEKHRIAFEMGDDVFPIEVVRINETEFCISGNGRHRYYGAIKAGMKFIDVVVKNE